MSESILEEAREQMDKSIQALHKDLNRVRTGRASLSLLDGIKVDYYGTLTPIDQIATLSIPESRLITIQPWDTNIIGDIEKVIQKSDLGLNPMNDGKIIRINIPNLSEERRKELVKQARKTAEEFRVAVRNVRREGIDVMKKQKNDKEISEDDLFKFQDAIQAETDKYVKQIDEITDNKETEMMEV